VKQGEAVKAQRVACALGRFWHSRCSLGEGRAWATITIAWFGDT
jgi:hypothetical protein